MKVTELYLIISNDFNILSQNNPLNQKREIQPQSNKYLKIVVPFFSKITVT